MSWVPALAIGGGILALGPILIHILFRRRYRRVEFAAMRFLLESLKRNKQRLRREELILIALRVLGCLLLGLFLANIRTDTLLPGAAAPVAHVFILDDSLSMGQRTGQQTLFQKALAEIDARIRRIPDADRVAILSATRPDDGSPLSSLLPAADAKKEEFLSRLAGRRPTDLRADLPATLAAAGRLLAPPNDLPGHLLVVSDFRRVDVADEASAAALRRAFTSLGPAVAEITCLDFGLLAPRNLAIERVALDAPLVVAGVSAPVRVIVRNTGAETVSDAKVAAQVGAVALPAETLPPIAPGQRAPVEFRIAFPTPGAAAVEVSLPPDLFPADDRAALAVDVREALRVLIVDGSPNPGSLRSASFCLARALDPSGRAAFAQRVDVAAAETWTAADLDAYDAVILANVPAFPAARDEAGRPVYPHVQALDRYVRDGGGLALFLGDRIQPEFYNGPLHAGGAGLNPLRLDPPPGAAPDPARFVRLNPDTMGSSPMLRLFAARGEAFCRLIRFYAFVPASLPPGASTGGRPGGAPRVVATFDDAGRSPAAVERPFGRGRVVVWTTAADTNWSDWPKALSFLPVMNDLVWSIARASGETFDDVVGEPIRYAVPTALADATSILLKSPAYPAEDLQRLAVRDQGGQRMVTYSAARHAGLYTLTFTLPGGSSRPVIFSRHPDPRESELAPAGEAAVAAAVNRPHRYITPLAGATASEASPTRAAWGYLLAILLGVLTIETVLGLRFGHYHDVAPERARSRTI
jgi:hypothetical protein